MTNLEVDIGGLASRYGILVVEDGARNTSNASFLGFDDAGVYFLQELVRGKELKCLGEQSVSRDAFPDDANNSNLSLRHHTSFLSQR